MTIRQFASKALNVVAAIVVLTFIIGSCGIAWWGITHSDEVYDSGAFTRQRIDDRKANVGIATSKALAEQQEQLNAMSDDFDGLRADLQTAGERFAKIEAWIKRIEQRLDDEKRHNDERWRSIRKEERGCGR